MLFALGRASKLPVVRMLCVIFIEFWRGVPLIPVLFFATYMLPLFLPGNWRFDPLARVLVGEVLFAGAYMAEVVRGGLQAVPRGQYEGATALGLGYWGMMGFVVLPQALKYVIPAMVNSFIALFKDTTLVLIVSIFDLLGIAQAALADPAWVGMNMEAYVFAGAIYWFACFGLSQWSRLQEKRLQAAYGR